MSDPESAPHDADRPPSQQAAADPTKKGSAGPGKADALALSIGCLVFVIFFVAVVVVSIMRD